MCKKTFRFFNVSLADARELEECVKILRIFNVLKRSVSNVRSSGEYLIKYVVFGRKGSDDGRNAAGFCQRGATVSPHSARPELLFGRF